MAVKRIVPHTYINQTYVSNLAALDALLNHKGNTATNNHDPKKFKTQIHVSDTVQQLGDWIENHQITIPKAALGSINLNNHFVLNTF